MKTNIVLIGFMGTGKTAAGHLLAEKLNWKFIDTDKIIEDIAEKDIPRIFREEGEKVFRQYEVKAIKMAGHLSNNVISTGGGCVMNDENVENLKHAGHVVLLSAAPEKIFERIKDDSSRPLLQVANPLARIKDLLKTRFPFYIRASEYNVDTSDLTIEQVVDTILEELNMKEK